VEGVYFVEHLGGEPEGQYRVRSTTQGDEGSL
jgi:hypothetical protein